jgi:hypothetical protein
MEVTSLQDTEKNLAELIVSSAFASIWRNMHSASIHLALSLQCRFANFGTLIN